MKKDKKEGSGSIKLIRKSNDLVEGRYRFDIWETRVFTKMLTLIKKDDEDFKEYRIFLKDVVKDFGLSHKNSYKMLKDGAKGLTKKEIRIIRDTPEGLKEFQTHIAVGVDSFVKDGNYVDISFHPKMKPFLLQLQTQYLMYDIRNVLGIQSSFSVRIYELLKQYERIGKRRFSVQELKEMLDISDKYPLYANFKQRVILKAQEDLQESTDIRFTFDEIKNGKQISELVFNIFKNSSVVDLRNEEETEEPPLLNTDILNLIEREVFSMVREFKGANPKTVEKWLKLYPEGYIKSRITLVKNLMQVGHKIANPMGFIQSMMSQPDIFDPIQEEKNLQEAQKQKSKQEQKVKAEKLSKEQKLEQLRQDFSDSKLKLIEQLLEENSGLASEFTAELKSLREQVNPPFIIQIALEHYATNLVGITAGSNEELLYNYKQGGSFGALMMDWFENKFNKDFSELSVFFEQKMQDIM